mmetsp:Transcript_8509/g.10568  ORF Transcript_8509/g.10568 Transcript_8509/m.10568 type:complete len:253 (+) Transcript_8509:1337-2095(+)
MKLRFSVYLKISASAVSAKARLVKKKLTSTSKEWQCSASKQKKIFEGQETTAGTEKNWNSSWKTLMLGLPPANPRPGSRKTKRRKKQCRLQLHPSHTLILYTLPQVANACNQLKDYLASAKYLRRLVKVMEELQPENFPETADFLFALGESLKNFLDARNANSALPKKTADQYRTEARNAFIRCHKIRTICLGPDNKATRDALKLMTAIGGADVNTYLATLPTPPIQGGEDGRSSPMILPPTALLQQQTQKS